MQNVTCSPSFNLNALAAWCMPEFKKPSVCLQVEDSRLSDFSLSKTYQYCLQPKTKGYFKLSMFRLNHRDLYTLNPHDFIRKGQEWLDLSTISHPTIRIFSPNQDTFRPVQLPYAMKSGENTRDPWPSNAKGFLYYFCPSGAPPIASEVRLRLTPVNDPKAFEQGEDLHLSNGQPWRRPIYSIATNSVLGPLYDKLRQEGLVSSKLDKALKALPKLTFMYSRCQIIHTLTDTFILDLSSDWHTLVAISEKGIAPIHILRQFRDFRLDVTPYKGALCLFPHCSIKEDSIYCLFKESSTPNSNVPLSQLTKAHAQSY